MIWTGQHFTQLMNQGSLPEPRIIISSPHRLQIKAWTLFGSPLGESGISGVAAAGVRIPRNWAPIWVREAFIKRYSIKWQMLSLEGHPTPASQENIIREFVQT